MAEEFRRLRAFAAILLNGSPEDLRAFLAPLDEPTRAGLCESSIERRGRQLSSVEYCVDNLLADHAAILFEYGASAAASSIQKALSDAVYNAAWYRFIRILEVVVAAARSQGSLAEIMHAEYRDAKELSNVFSADFAPALGTLLDAHLGNGDTVSRPALVRSAASCGGLACLQLLHERCSRDDWSQLLTPVPGIVRESPLAFAFGACESGAFEYLLSFHSPSGAD
jgi:hypothetical protein